MFLRYALLSFDFLCCMYDNMFGLLGLSQFSQNVAINAKGGDFWQYDQQIRVSMSDSCIYGNIFYFADNLQLFVKENCLSIWIVMQNAKYWSKWNIPLEYSYVQLTKDAWHHDDDVS